MTCLFSFTACGNKGTTENLSKGETAKGTASIADGSDTGSIQAAAKEPGVTVKAEPVVTETDADAMRTDEEGNIIIDAGNESVKLTENEDGTGTAVITKEDGTEIEVAVKKDNSGKLVVDTTKDITVMQPSAGGGSADTPAVTTSKLKVDDNGNVRVVTTATPIPTATLKATETPTPAPTQIPTVAEPTQPVITARPTSTPKPTKAPTPTATEKPKPTATETPKSEIDSKSSETCEHKHLISVTEQRTITKPAWDEEVKKKIGTEECRGCGQYEIDFEEAWEAHDTDKLVEYYLTGHSQKDIDTFYKQAEKYGLEWLVYESGDGTCHEFFIGHCTDCDGGANWGDCRIERVVDVIHHDETAFTDDIIVGSYCKDCKTWIWREDGNLKTPAP